MEFEVEPVSAAGEAPLRVTVVAPCPFPGSRGTAARVLLESRALAALGVDVRIATYHLAESPAPRELRVERIPDVPSYRRLHAGPTAQKLLLLAPLLFARTLATARAQRAQLIHGHHVEGALVALAAARVLGLPVVFDAHTSLREELPSYPIPLPRALLRAAGAGLDGWLVRRSDRVIAVTERLRQELLRCAASGRAQERIAVIPTPLEPEETPAAPPANETSRCEPGRTIVYAGGLSRFQRLDLLRAAFDRLRPEIRGLRLVVVSNDPPEALEASWPGARGDPAVQVVPAPDLEAMFRALRQADVAVSPRTAPGGLPQKLLNYMRVGLPIVACQGSADPLRDGETALVVPDDDAAALAAALQRLLGSPALRQRLGRAAREVARVEFDAAVQARRIAAVYRAALAERRTADVRGRARLSTP